MDSRNNQTLSDQTIDRELEQMLGVEPSGDFLARVRTQITYQRIAPRTFRPLVTAVVCGLVIVAAVFVTIQPGKRTKAVASAPAVPAFAPGLATLQSVESEPPRHTSERAVVSPKRVTAQSTERSSRDELPEVLISPVDKAAFENFIASVYERRFKVSADTAVQILDAHARNDLAIAPITIDALLPPEPLASSEGVIQ